MAVHDQKLLSVLHTSVNAAAIVSGAAFIFENSNNGWTLQNKFEGTSGSTRFGQAVAIDSDRIAVGAPSDANDGYESGAISTYRFAGGWYRDAVIRNGPGAPRNRIGSTLSLSNGRLLVGIRPEQNLNGSSPCMSTRQVVGSAKEFLILAQLGMCAEIRALLALHI